MGGRIKSLINLYDFLKWKRSSVVPLIGFGDNCWVAKAVNSDYSHPRLFTVFKMITSSSLVNLYHSFGGGDLF
jgi:hypothetical protein